MIYTLEFSTYACLIITILCIIFVCVYWRNKKNVTAVIEFFAELAGILFAGVFVEVSIKYHLYRQRLYSTEYVKSLEEQIEIYKNPVTNIDGKKFTGDFYYKSDKLEVERKNGNLTVHY